MIIKIKKKTLVLSENLMNTKTFTHCPCDPFKKAYQLAAIEWGWEGSVGL